MQVVVSRLQPMTEKYWNNEFVIDRMSLQSPYYILCKMIKKNMEGCKIF